MSKGVSFVDLIGFQLIFRLGEELKYVKDNSDTWLGFAVWSVSQLRYTCLSRAEL
jgi:hypothetical protein